MDTEKSLQKKIKSEIDKLFSRRIFDDDVLAIIATAVKLSNKQGPDLINNFLSGVKQVLEEYCVPTERMIRGKSTFLEILTTWVLTVISFRVNYTADRNFIKYLANELKSSIQNHKDGIFLYYCQKNEERKLINDYDSMRIFFDDAIRNNHDTAFCSLQPEIALCWDMFQKHYIGVLKEVSFCLPKILPDQKKQGLSVEENYLVNILRDYDNVNDKDPVHVIRKRKNISSVSFGLNSTDEEQVELKLSEIGFDKPRHNIIVKKYYSTAKRGNKPSISVEVFFN